jgi:outer membrane immunogenic protein
VAGVELEAGYLDLGATVQRDVTGGYVTSGADLGAFAALSGRLGVVMGGSWLAYGRAGLVVAQMQGTTAQTCTGVDLCGGAQSTPVSSATTRDVSFGFLLGAGVEYKLTEHWNGRLEYQFMSLRKELALPAIDGPGWNNQVDVHALKLGLSYRF